jgi:hypothetical protein
VLAHACLNELPRRAAAPLHPCRFEIARLASRERQDGQQSSQTPLTMPVLAASASRHAAVLGLLACSALWGTLARLGLSALNSYDGHSIAPVIWAQGVGCFVMGWALGNRAEIESRCVPILAALALVEGDRRRGAALGWRCRTASTPAVLTPRCARQICPALHCHHDGALREHHDLQRVDPGGVPRLWRPEALQPQRPAECECRRRAVQRRGRPNRDEDASAEL